MKKIILILIALMMFLPGMKVYAIDDETKDKLNKNEKIQNFYNYLEKTKTDDELLNGLNARDYVANYLKSGQGTISTDQVINSIISLCFKEIKITLNFMVAIICLALISALLKNLQNSFSTEEVTNIAFYACYAVIVMLLTKSFLISIDVAKETIYKLMNFTAVLLPTLVVLLGTAGGITQALTIDPIVIMAVSLTPKLYGDILIPIILSYFALNFVNNLSEEHRIDGLCKFIKQTVIWFQGAVITIFIGLLTVRGITSNTIDAVTLKTVKFAMDNFIPLVGKALSDAITSVAAYSLLLKNAISSIGLIIIILYMIYPIIKIVIMSLIYKLSAAVIEPVADKRIVSCITTAGDALTLLFTCVLSISIMFFVMVAIMASAGKFIVGG